MYLGIDLGTTSLKVILTDDHLQCVATASAPLSISRPAPLFSEQNPHDWWNALNTTMLELRAKNSSEMKKVIAVGLSGQQHGATLLDQSNRVLRPAILWNDGRASAECSSLMQAVPNACDIVGSVLMPGFTAPKLGWVKKHEFELFKKTHKILLPKDYLRLLMSGDYATDLSDASGTGWLDVQKRRWSDDLLSACELDVQHMPQLFEGNAVTGVVQSSVANAWGLSDRVKIIAGAGDNAASAMSMGCVNKETMILSLGTSATFFMAIPEFEPNIGVGVHTFCHAVPDFWHHMAVHLNGASCLTWTAELLHQDLSQLIISSEKNHHDNTVLFIPYLSGERTPHNNPHATGAWLGLTHTTHSAVMMQSVLEGVAFGLREGYCAITKNASSVNEMTVVGGGTKSHYWGKIIASILNQPLTYRYSSAIGAAFGAAKLAWLSETQSDPRDSFCMPAIENVILPEKAWVEHYNDQYDLFKKIFYSINKAGVGSERKSNHTADTPTPTLNSQ